MDVSQAGGLGGVAGPCAGRCLCGAQPRCAPLLGYITRQSTGSQSNRLVHHGCQVNQPPQNCRLLSAPGDDNDANGNGNRNGMGRWVPPVTRRLYSRIAAYQIRRTLSSNLRASCCSEGPSHGRAGRAAALVVGGGLAPCQPPANRQRTASEPASRAFRIQSWSWSWVSLDRRPRHRGSCLFEGRLSGLHNGGGWQRASSQSGRANLLRTLRSKRDLWRLLAHSSVIDPLSVLSSDGSP
jgi:hypothetical protein